MHSYLVVDSSILIFFDRKGKLQEFLQQKKKENYKVVIPEAIEREVVDEPREFAQKIQTSFPSLADKILDSVDNMSNAIEQGFIKVEIVNYRKYSKLMDNVRKHLSKLESKPEYAVKKGDPEFVALVVQLCEENSAKVLVMTLDKGLLKALKPFRAKASYEIAEKS